MQKRLNTIYKKNSVLGTKHYPALVHAWADAELPSITRKSPYLIT